LAYATPSFRSQLREGKCHLSTTCVGAEGKGQINHPVETPPFSLEGEHEIKNANLSSSKHYSANLKHEPATIRAR
jgi:hypothetical protein